MTARSDATAEAPRDTVEAPRDVAESAFTPILRALLHSVPGTLGAVFVDGEGECIDYCSLLPPFDTKVLGAHMLVVAMNVRRAITARHGEPWFVHVHGTERDLLLRRVADEYLLVVATRAMGLTSLLHDAVEQAVRALRAESGIAPPRWEPAGDRVRVEIRLSTTGWAYAPRAFWHRGERIGIADVIGRWVDVEPPAREGEAAREAVCFLVRCERGIERTLVHRVDEDRWELG